MNFCNIFLIEFEMISSTFKHKKKREIKILNKSAHATTDILITKTLPAGFRMLHN